MKFSPRTLLKLKIKNKRLKPDINKKLKGNQYVVESKVLSNDRDYQFIVQTKTFMHK
jgi:hypothetical protein